MPSQKKKVVSYTTEEIEGSFDTIEEAVRDHEANFGIDPQGVDVIEVTERVIGKYKVEVNKVK